MMGVSIAPGLMTFVRILRSFSSLVHVRAKVLRGAIRALRRKPLWPHGGTGENNGTTVVHQWQRLLNGEVDTTRVGIERLVEMLRCHVARLLEFHGSGIGEDDINLAFLRSNSFIEIVNILELGNVTAHCSDVLADFCDGLIQFRLAPPHDEDLGTFFHKPFCRG